MRRVAITGLGVVSPVGVGTKAFWDGLVNGRSGTTPLSDATVADRFEGFSFSSQVIGAVGDFDGERAELPDEVSGLDRYIQFAVAGARQACLDAGLAMGPLRGDRPDPDRLGIALATAICGTPQMEAGFVTATGGGHGPVDPAKADPDLYLASISNTPGVILSALMGARGPCLALSTGCVGGMDAVGYAFDSIKDGETDVMIAGASEAPITPITSAAFEIINCLSVRHNEHPERASRPFDAQRDGFVLAEGCGIVVLEELEHARARGADIYAEMTGFATVSNALHMTDLLSDGADLARVIGDALAEDGTPPGRVDHVNAHGSSTPQNDLCETKALRLALGEHAHHIPINATKSMTGHALSAASAMEIVACCLALRHDTLHPTINYEEPDPLCDLDYVPHRPRPWNGSVIVSCASGFSGLHSAVAMRRWGGERP
jgi:3-oxoacyl-(acyl-carrier-protein) synthase